jgi:Skp family chaperone for outer membrane proteins
MKKAAAVLALLLSAPLATAEPPRVAVVRVSDVFKQLESTVQANEILKAKREEILKDKRLAAYNELSTDLQARNKQLTEGRNKIDAATVAKLEREYAIKRQEAKSLLEDFESYRTERTREINAEMVAGMRQRLSEIHATSEKIAKEEGFDWVLDGSGNTNTGVPLLLYAKATNDLTDRVVAAIGKAAAPPEPAPAPAPKPPTGKKR